MAHLRSRNAYWPQNAAPEWVLRWDDGVAGRAWVLYRVDAGQLSETLRRSVARLTPGELIDMVSAHTGADVARVLVDDFATSPEVFAAS
jgi:hypothetical protein